MKGLFNKQTQTKTGLILADVTCGERYDARPC